MFINIAINNEKQNNAININAINTPKVAANIILKNCFIRYFFINFDDKYTQLICLYYIFDAIYDEKMNLRKATFEDIPAMMEIFYQSQASLKALGVDQWQNNYPNIDVVRKDVENATAYVLTIDDRVIATATIIFNHEPTYDRIFEGEWLSQCEFVVVHRVAVDSSYKMMGVASYILKEVEKIATKANIPSIKIDTHKDNFPMRKTIEKNGFTYCGRIILLDGNSRVAYEKLLI